MTYAGDTATDEGRDPPGNVIDDLEILILTDSEYLVKGISEHIWKWKKNDFKNSKTKPMVNGRAFGDLGCVFEELEDRGVPVWFWLVKEKRQQASIRTG